MKKMENMGGFFVAAITPFDNEGKFNPTMLHKLMDRTIEQGAAGFVIGGSSAAFGLDTEIASPALFS